MAERPRMNLSGVVLDAPDANALAEFYERLLGWTRIQDEPGWVKLSDFDDGPGLSFQEEPLYRPPVWPSTAADPQLQVHLDIQVDDLDEGQAFALAVGARLSDVQFEDDVRIFFDPVGHPFCLFVQG
jgi:catechol 2,3-dioxygenase-like lactoylglutathione lyase family enzyme